VNSIARERLKEQLRAMIAGRGDGIDLDSVDRWVVEGVKDPIAFFRHIGELIPADSILYFEGTEIMPEVARFYENNRAANAVCVVRDCIFPVPETFHVAMSPGVVGALMNLLRNHPLETCFHHVKAYREKTLLFAFHDAFDGSNLLVSDLIPEESVRCFTSSLGGICRRERNVDERDPEELPRLLWALENSDKLRINWPWWKKALFFWKR
jgi:hypothetical protein